jgi:beta-glucanase (GH16 family)
MESVGRTPLRASANIIFPDTKKGYTGAVTLKKPYDEDFHVFAMERREDRIDFLIDGKKYHSFRVDEAGTGPDNPFRKPHYLILNLAMGGVAGGRIDDASLPQRYLIDYVRVYTLKGGRQFETGK